MMTRQKWNFTIMAHGLPNDQYVLDEKLGAILEILHQCTYHWLCKLKLKMTYVY